MAQYVAKHRAQPVRTPWHRHPATWSAGALATVAVGGVAHAATNPHGAMTASGTVAAGAAMPPVRPAATSPVAAVIAGRSVDDLRVSRSLARPDATAAAKAAAAKAAAAKAAAAKAAAAKAAAEKAPVTRKERKQPAPVARHAAPPVVQAPAKPVALPVPSGDPHAIAAGMLASYGWSASQMGCLDALWNRESGWNIYASNPSSGAYGIPQSLPGSKMASAGPDWQSNPATQIRWGLGYIAARYGSPCGAWGHSQATGWY